LTGVEAVIDKDATSALLARDLKASVLLMLTDVAAVYQPWSAPEQRAIRRISPSALSRFSFAAGSMAPKIQAACEFAEAIGGMAGIGLLKDAQAILAGAAGTVISADAADIIWWD
jgi:carbamate kinase